EGVHFPFVSDPAISHPAPFSASIMDVLADLIADWEGPILDPYAGVGRVHELGRDDTFGIEIESEWADTHHRTFCGDSSHLIVTGGRMMSCVNGTQVADLERPNAVVTSPDYGNRMADQYLGTPEE